MSPSPIRGGPASPFFVPTVLAHVSRMDRMAAMSPIGPRVVTRSRQTERDERSRTPLAPKVDPTAFRNKPDSDLTAIRNVRQSVSGNSGKGNYAQKEISLVASEISFWAYVPDR